MTRTRFQQRRHGTRFRIYPQAHEGFFEPETVWLSLPPGAIGPGPSDARMHVVDALDKMGPYEPPLLQPPFRGRVGPPALPQRDGHFDRIPVSDRKFLSAHIYGSARRVLDVWETLLGRRIEWWHAAAFPSLELIPLVHWDNAQSGGGFVEMGARRNDCGELQLFCLNFEIVGHEIGHTIIFSELGVPDPDRLTGEYLAFQESFADLVALTSVLFFDSCVSRLLAQTHGNLYTLNLLSRIGELSQTQQIRIADNVTRMRDLAGLRFGGPDGWIDATGAGRNAHDLAQPLTGAIFDILVEVFQDRLVARGVIPPDADARGWTRDEVEAAMDSFEARWGRAFARFEPQFREALLEARDVVGRALALVLERIAANDLSFARVAALFVEACRELGQAHHLDAIRENFLERDIDPGPRDAACAHRLRAPTRRLAVSPGACLAARAAALRRARRLAARAGMAERGARGRTVLIDRLLRRDHRRPNGLES